LWSSTSSLEKIKLGSSLVPSYSNPVDSEAATSDDDLWNG
jgi:hypothetical protein